MQVVVKRGETAATVKLTKREQDLLDGAASLLTLLDKHLDGGAKKAAADAGVALVSLKQHLKGGAE